MIEPNCDMPWDIYLDWLQDQGNEDLRFIDIGSILSGLSYVPFVCTSRGGCCTGDGSDGLGCAEVFFRNTERKMVFLGENCRINHRGDDTSSGCPSDCSTGHGDLRQQGFGNSQFFTI